MCLLCLRVFSFLLSAFFVGKHLCINFSCRRSYSFAYFHSLDLGFSVRAFRHSVLCTIFVRFFLLLLLLLGRLFVWCDVLNIVQSFTFSRNGFKQSLFKLDGGISPRMMNGTNLNKFWLTGISWNAKIKTPVKVCVYCELHTFFRPPLPIFCCCCISPSLAQLLLYVFVFFNRFAWGEQMPVNYNLCDL